MRTALLAAALWWVLQGAAPALINPKFTPVHLVKDSEAILALRLDGGAKEGVAMAAVEKALKGQLGKKSLEIELAGSSKPEQARLIEKSIRAQKGSPALMFIGAWPARPGEENPGAQPPAARKALVHLNGSWLVLVEDDRGVWGFDEVSQPMVATWNGGTDMLERAVEYILKDAAAELPVRTGVRWGGHAKLGSVGGKVSVALPVDLRCDGKPVLHVASDAGDRLFTFEGKTGRDVTEKLGLSAKSRAAAWGDFNADGLVDLASWDGKVLQLLLQGRGGSFSATDVPGLTECLDLAVIDVGTPGKAGLIVGTRAAPLLLLPGTAPRALSEVAPWGDGPGPCLVADFDGDGLPDVLQLRSKGSVLYKGTGPRRFAAPAACGVAYGTGRSACLGDWDGDGRLDIFVAGEGGCALWQNIGDGQFVESLKLSGEVGYASKPGCVGACNGDLNNDGRQDIVILYGGAGPQVFFNRGFRSFGLSASMDLGTGETLPALLKGQQAGCLADFDGDGCQELALVLSDGQVVVLSRAPGGSDLCAKLALPAGMAGPLTVTAARGGRMLGAWNVRSALADAFLGRPEPGPVTLRWQFPGGRPQQREITIEDKPLRVVLEPQATK
jgi:hypothetical protein